MQLWGARILGTSLFEFCVYILYECIVKNGAGNGCGTGHVSKKYQHP